MFLVRKLSKISMMTFVFLVSFLTPLKASSVLNQLENELFQLVEKVKPSVVTVKAEIRANPASGEELPPVVRIGSGIVFDSNRILTRASIVEGCQSAEIHFCDSTYVNARVVGLDPDFGFALLETSTSTLTPAKMSDQSKLEPGSWIMIMGNALGISPAVAVGVVNGIRKDGLVQISADLVAGSAGGAIFNTNGELVGMVAATVSPGNTTLIQPFQATHSATLAFQIELMNQRIRAMEALTRQQHGYLGVSGENVGGTDGWVHITSVTENSPAQKAGLKAGDMIKGVDTETAQGTRHLADYVRNRKPGEQINLSINRNDSTLTFPVTLGTTNQPLLPTATLRSRTTFKTMRAEPIAREEEIISKEQILEKISRMEKELILLKKSLR